MKFILIVIIHVLFTLSLSSQNLTINLWPEGKIPNQRVTDEQEIEETTNILWVRNVQQPAIDVYLPSIRNSKGEAVVIFPGGGYYGLAYDWEGTDVAKWLNSQGIVAVVVKYRLPTSKSLIEPYKAPIQDAMRALRLVRSYSKEWQIEEDKIGIMGFSAGGHLASTLGTHFSASYYDPIDDIDKLSPKPDFMALIYPVIKMGTPDSHRGSAVALLGEEATKDKLDAFSNQNRVTNDIPRTFILHSIDDTVVPVSNSQAIFQALLDKNISVECHFYPTGGHGFGLGLTDPSVASWTDLFVQWLRE